MDATKIIIKTNSILFFFPIDDNIPKITLFMNLSDVVFVHMCLEYETGQISHPPREERMCVPAWDMNINVGYVQKREGACVDGRKKNDLPRSAFLFP